MKILMKTISWHSYVNSDLCRRRSWVIEDVHRCPLLVGDQRYVFPHETELYRDLRGWRTIRKTQEHLTTGGQRLSINHTDGRDNRCKLALWLESGSIIYCALSLSNKPKIKINTSLILILIIMIIVDIM